MKQNKRHRKQGRGNSRDTLLAAAGALFEQNGFHQVSVDQIARVAGIAKTALYHHFGSKEGLVIAFLEHHLKAIEDSLIDAAMKVSEPRARLRVVFNWQTNWFHKPDFAGDVFLRALHDYKGRQPAIEELARVQKRAVRHALRALVEGCGVAATRSEDLSHELLYLLDGATTTAFILDEHDAAEQAWLAAECLLDSEIERSAVRSDI